MPSFSIPSALLALATFSGAPWNWPSWQDITGIMGTPWESDPVTNTMQWTKDTIDAVAAYKSNFTAIQSTVDQQAYGTRRKHDNDALGRTTWNSFVSTNWERRWKLNTIIDEVLRQVEVDPISVMSRMETRKVSITVSRKSGGAGIANGCHGRRCPPRKRRSSSELTPRWLPGFSESTRSLGQPFLHCQ